MVNGQSNGMVIGLQENSPWLMPRAFPFDPLMTGEGINLHLLRGTIGHFSLDHLLKTIVLLALLHLT